MKKTFYKTLGFVFLGLAGLGILLPVLPTTPFVLLAAWFFAQSSDRWHAWLRRNRLFGPMIYNWETARCISCRSKIVTLSAMLLAGAVSVLFLLDSTILKGLALAVLGIGSGAVLAVKTCPSNR